MPKNFSFGVLQSDARTKRKRAFRAPAKDVDDRDDYEKDRELDESFNDLQNNLYDSEGGGEENEQLHDQLEESLNALKEDNEHRENDEEKDEDSDNVKDQGTRTSSGYYLKLSPDFTEESHPWDNDRKVKKKKGKQ